VRDFLKESLDTNAAGIQKAQLDHALKQARAYIRFCRKANSTEGARYSMYEYLKLQGVRADLIPTACQKAEEKYGSQ